MSKYASGLLFNVLIIDILNKLRLILSTYIVKSKYIWSILVLVLKYTWFVLTNIKTNLGIFGLYMYLIF